MKKKNISLLIVYDKWVWVKRKRILRLFLSRFYQFVTRTYVCYKFGTEKWRKHHIDEINWAMFATQMMIIGNVFV